MNNKAIVIIIVVICGFFVFKTCSSFLSSSKDKSVRYTQVNQKKVLAIDKLIKKMASIPDYSIILNDMDMSGSGTNAIYKHKYQILIPKSYKDEKTQEKRDTIIQELSDWEYVSAEYFDKNINNLGMELVSKKNFVLTKQAVPAGYNHYVGNEKYGTWRTNSSGGSFWEFYGKYAFMSSMLNMVAFPARRAYWNDYYNGGYYGGSRSYYGPRGAAPVYGTRKFASSPAARGTTWGSKPNSFRENVRSNVKRSVTASKYSNRSSKYSSSSRTTRSSSRYSRSYSRSRSGGFGK